MDLGVGFPFVGLMVLSVLGVIRWRQVISGERDLYTRIDSVWPWGTASAKAYARCFPLMILNVWLLAIALGVILAADAGVISFDPKRTRWLFAGAAGVLLALAVSVALVNKPGFIVPRTKRHERGLLQWGHGRHSTGG